MDRRRIDVSLERLVDDLCDRFEKRLQAGEHPDVDEYLGAAPAAAQAALAVELLRLAVEYAGTRPNRDEGAPQHASDTNGFHAPHSETEAGLTQGNTSASNVTDSPAIGESLGDYDLLSVVGAGGMGTVYRARQRSVGRIVALKVLHPHRWQGLSDHQRRLAIERFQREACAAARHEHTNVVTVYDGGHADGSYYLALQFIDGKSLAAIVREAPLDNRRAAAYLEPICRGLHGFHQAGILHRDIKPSNILIEQASDRALLTDFGLAKVLEGEHDLTVSGEVFGSPPYMSPEQVTNASLVATATDVYGIGATLYHLLTGRPPFQATTVPGTLHQVLSTEPVEPRRLNPSVDRDLETICLKCLEKDPHQRYPDALSIAKELQRYLAGQPIEARPLGSVHRAIRWCRRRPAVAGLLGTLAVTVVVAFGMISTLYVRERAATAGLIAKVTEDRRKEAGISVDPPSTAAMAWIVSNLSIERDPARQLEDRIRMQRLLAVCPTLVQQAHSVVGIKSVEFSPDGQQFLTCDSNGLVQLWPVEGHGTPLKELRHAEENVRAIARLSPDGKSFATAGADGRTYLWDFASFDLVREFPTQQSVSKLEFTELKFSHDGRLLAAGNRGSQIHVWEVKSAKEAVLLLSLSGPIAQIAFSPQGDLLAASDSRDHLSVWSVPSGTAMLTHRMRHGFYSRVAFDRRGQFLLGASPFGGAELRRVDSLATPIALQQLGQMIVEAQFAADADKACSLTKSGQVVLWTPDQPDKPLWSRKLDQEGHCAAISRDGGKLAVGSTSQVEIWNCHDPISKLAEISTPVSPRRLQFSPDGTRLMVADAFQIRIWRLPTPGDIEQPLPNPKLDQATYAEQADLFFGANENLTTSVDRIHPQVKPVYSLQRATQTILPLGPPRGSTYVTAELNGNLWLHDLNHPQAPPAAHTNIASLISIAISRDGQKIAAVNAQGKCLILPTNDPDHPLHELELGLPARWLAFDSSGERLVAIASTAVMVVGLHERPPRFESFPTDSTADVTEFADGAAALDFKGTITRLQFDRNGDHHVRRVSLEAPGTHFWTDLQGRLAAVALPERELRIYDLDAAEAISVALEHSDAVVAASFSQSGQLLATLASDGSLRLWGVGSVSPIMHVPAPGRAPRNIYFVDGDQRLLAIYRGSVLSVNIQPDTRSTDDLMRDARLWSGLVVDELGTPIPVPRQELDQDWKARGIAR